MNSLYSVLQKTSKMFENLEAIRLILNLDDNDYKFLTLRTEANIASEDVRQFLELNSFNLSNLVYKISDDFKIINMALEKELGSFKTNIKNHDQTWRNFVLKKREDTSDFIYDVGETLEVCKKWKAYLEKEEDRGSESSYSDYSGESTVSSDTEENSESD